PLLCCHRLHPSSWWKSLCTLQKNMLIPALSHHHRMVPINPTRREARRTFVGRLPGGGGESSRTAGPSARRLTLGRQDRPPPDARDNARKPGTPGRPASRTKLLRDVGRPGARSLTSPEGTTC